jgi:hypothetical protein
VIVFADVKEQTAKIPTIEKIRAALNLIAYSPLKKVIATLSFHRTA